MTYNKIPLYLLTSTRIKNENIEIIKLVKCKMYDSDMYKVIISPRKISKMYVFYNKQ